MCGFHLEQGFFEGYSLSTPYLRWSVSFAGRFMYHKEIQARVTRRVVVAALTADAGPPVGAQNTETVRRPLKQVVGAAQALMPLRNR
jgi:hypothetical protein